MIVYSAEVQTDILEVFPVSSHYMFDVFAGKRIAVEVDVGQKLQLGVLNLPDEAFGVDWFREGIVCNESALVREFFEQSTIKLFLFQLLPFTQPVAIQCDNCGYFLIGISLKVHHFGNGSVLIDIIAGYLYSLDCWQHLRNEGLWSFLIFYFGRLEYDELQLRNQL